MNLKTVLATSSLILFVTICVTLGQQSQREHTAGGRFDNLVREDFFTGIGGDDAAFARAMKLCEERLKSNPRDAEAMAWHGAGLYFQAGQAFRRNDRTAGIRLRNQGRQEMDEAVQLSPSVVTLIPRGAVLLSASKRIVDSQIREATLKQGVDDFERVLELDKSNFPTRCQHAKGELLGGLAEGWYRLGNQQKASVYLARMVTELPHSPYSEAASRALNQKPGASEISTTCLSCHSSTR
jgi:hypothetical protein